MSDFIALNWSKQPLTGDVSRALRKDVRTYRRERGRGDHRFSYTCLKTLWAADDGLHVVCNHIDDPAWQMWYRHPASGWIMIDWHLTRREAQAAAESKHPELVERKPKVFPGINVLAGWPDRDPTMRVHCSSEATAAAVADAFVKIGCITGRELVATEVA